MNTGRQGLLALLCLLAAVGSYLLTPRQFLADLEPVNLEQMVPLQFGDWKALPQHDDVITSPEQEAYIKSIYSQTLSRVYADSQGHSVMLSIAYTRDQSDNAGTQSHKPEICYPAQGFVIQQSEITQMDTGFGAIKVKRLTAVQGSRVEPLIYWTMIGTRSAVDQFGLKWAKLEYGVHDIIPDGLIFRVSEIYTDGTKIFSTQEQFSRDLMESVTPKNRVRFIGEF